MPNFSFQARNEKKEIITGVVEAENESAALALVKDEGLDAFSIFPYKKSLLQLDLDFLRPVKAKDIVIFSRQLAVMVEASLPLVDSLNILRKQTPNLKLQSIISEISKEVEGGERLSLTLKRYSKVFSPFYINIVKSGETSGQLSEVLNYLADQLEKDYDLKAKVKGAMIYPAFILSMLVVVGFLMMIFVVPKITSILTETNVELPLATRILIGTSGWLVTYWWVVLVLVAALVIGVHFALKNKEVRYYYDWLLLKAPVFGHLFQRVYVLRITRSLSTLSAGKVPLTDALEIVRDVVENTVYKTLIDETITEVKDGNSIATVFVQSSEIPNMVSQMLVVGEETGRLDDILKRLSDFYSREIDNILANLVTLIEPIIMILMGVAVGTMVAAVIMPIYNLSTGI